jgi:pimeloyl-ACP methyl ester carboxylesterase
MTEETTVRESVVRAADVPRAGHWLIEENPEFVVNELLLFLDGLPRQRRS